MKPATPSPGSRAPAPSSPDPAAPSGPATRTVRWTLGLLALVLLASSIFVAYRWHLRHEPLNSDDLNYFEIAEAASHGDSWLFEERPSHRQPHAALRIGLWPTMLPSLALFGPTHLAYHATPLLFALGGFLLVSYTNFRWVSPALAGAFALLHLGLPFELEHGSQLLVDLPAATLLLLALVLLGRSAELTGTTGRLGGGVAAGLALLWSYLLRTNSPLLAVPGLLYLAWRKESRVPTLAAGCVLSAGILAEQLLFMLKGLGWGFRWERVALALESYSPRLPTYDLEGFLLRQIDFLRGFFDGGWGGAFALAYYALSLLALAALLLRARPPVLRAIALTGLLAWGLFSFAVYEVDGETIRAMAPPNFRYLAPFHHASLVALCWGAARLLERALRRGAGREPHRRRVRLATAAVGLGVLVAAVASATLSARLPKRFATPEGDLRSALCALDAVAASDPAAAPSVLATHRSARLLSLYRHPGSEPPVEVVPTDLSELAGRMGEETTETIFLDEQRLAADLRFGRRGGDAERIALEEALWRGYQRVSGPGRYAVYHRIAKRPRLLPNGDFEEMDLASESIPSWQATSFAGLEPHPRGLAVERFPADGAPLYLYSGAGTGFSTPPRDAERYRLVPGRQYRVQVDLEMEGSVDASLFVIQFDPESRIASESERLRDGSSFVAFEAVPEASAYRLALRLAAGSGGSGEGRIVLRSVGLKPEAEPLCQNGEIVALPPEAAQTGTRP